MNSKGKKNTHTEKKLVLFLVFKIYKLMKLKAAEDKKESLKFFKGGAQNSVVERDEFQPAV
jgi:hypothetical protein